MARILLVDDEEGFRKQLEIGLAALGHEIRCASSGREAVDLGIRFRPDLLVTDWMLKDDIHGLHVVQVLRAVLADLRAILITGFASAELREDAGSADILDFVEKPFTLDHIRKAVRGALSAPPCARPAMLAAAEIRAGGEIAFANAKALDLFDETRVGREARKLSDLFPSGSEPNLDEALDRWSVVRPVADRKIAWHLRSQEPDEDGGRFIILRRSDDPQYLGLPIIEMLLGSISPRHMQWPFDGRVVIVDREAATRKWLVSMIENVGGGGYAVETAEQALRLLRNDDGLQFAVLDHDTLDAGLGRAIERIRSCRPDVTIVGNSPGDHRDAFARLGVPLFLQRPWRADDLINLLTGKIGNCVGCGIPLPLRRPRQGEQPCPWTCCNCGAVYSAVLDEDAGGDVISIVRRQDDGRQP